MRATSGNQQEKCDHDAGPATKGEAPANHVDDHAEVAGIANDAVDAASFELVIGLDGDESAESTTEHEDRVKPKRAAEDVDGDANPAGGFAVDRPEVDAIGVGRDDRAGEGDDAESYEDPSIGAVLFFAGVEVGVAERRDTEHHQSDYNQGDQRWMAYERCPAAEQINRYRELQRPRR